MESWRDSLSKYMQTWTSPTKEEGEDEEASERFGDANATLSDEEAQLSYPGTDDEEYEGSHTYERWEDASEDEDYDPTEDAAEALADAIKSVSNAEEIRAVVDEGKRGAYGMPSFRDILLGRKSTESQGAAAGGVEEVAEEWETDDEPSPDFPKLGEEAPPKKKASPFAWGGAKASEAKPQSSEAAPAAEKKAETAAPKPAAKASFMPSLPARGGSGPSLPPKPRASTETPGDSASASQAPPAASKPSLPSRPSLPPRRSTEKAPQAAESAAAKKEAEAEEEEAAKPAEAAAAAAPSATAAASTDQSAPSQATPAPPSASQPGPSVPRSLFMQQAQQPEPPAPEELSEEKRKLMETVSEHRVKLIRIAKRLGVGADNNVIKQVIFRLDMTEQVKLHGRSSRVALKETFKEAEAKAAAMEESGDDLDLECTVLIIGKSGVGKSTLVNNLLGLEDEEVERHAGKTSIREITGEAYGVKMRFIDVPGLQSSRAEAKRNRKILQAAKKVTKKHMPDIVLYCDRLDVPSYDFADIPLVRDISNTFGASIWWNALIVFTHGGSRAPEDSTGQIANFEYFQNHRGYIVQQMIRQAAGDARILNPVSVVECHHATKRNDKGDKLLPSGQAWKTYILLLCFASKVLHDANTALKLDNDMKDNKAAKNAQYAAFRRQQTPYPLFFNNLFQTRKPRRAQNLVEEEEILEQEAEMEMNEMESGFPGQEKDYPLNPFKQPLDQGDSRIDIPAPDPALAPTFDCDPTTNAHRYRYLENSNGWICRAIVEPDGLEHDDGINGFTAENYYNTLADPTSQDPRKKNPIPTYVMSQINMPDKGKLSLVAEIESSVCHKGKPGSAAKVAKKDAATEGGPKPGAEPAKKPPVTTGGIDVQSLGRDIMYVARAETRVKGSRKMKTCAGVSAFRSSLKFPHTGPLAFGAKVEERVKLNKRLRLNMTAGAIGGKAADGRTNQYLKGANVQFMVKGNKKKGEPTKLQVIGTAMHWKKDIALGGDVQAIQMVGPDSALTARANLNSRGSGSVQLRLTSTDTIKYGLVGVIPTVSALWGFLTGAM